MQKHTRSLLEELELVSSKRDNQYLIESRGHNIIASAINLLEMIHKHYTPEQAELLEKRLLSSIKNRDSSRFSRGIKKS